MKKLPKVQNLKNINRIALVGNRGVGKSSVAKMLSFFINFSYISTDNLIQYTENSETIHDIISRVGWKSFRKIEKEVLEKSVQFDNIIIDCGGGIISTIEDNSYSKEIFCNDKADLLCNSCYIIYIHADISWLLLNQKTDKNRPKYLTNPKDIISNREKWYYKIANYVIDRTNIDITLATLEIYHHIKNS